MKIRELCVYVILLCITMIGCGISNPKYKKPSKVVNTLPGVSIKTVETSYAPNLKNIKVIFTNTTNEKLMYGEEYTLEHYKNGKWYVVPFKKGICWNDTGYIINPQSTKEVTYNIKDNIGSLNTGKYHIIVQINILGEEPPKKFYDLTAEFTVR